MQLMSRRHELASKVRTSNKSFEAYADILDHEGMAVALIDRDFHHYHAVNVRGNSNRIGHHSEF
jgi:DNA replication protein DnaC